MKFSLPQLETGSKIKFDVNIASGMGGTLRYDLFDHSFSTKIDLPQEKQQIFSMELVTILLSHWIFSLRHSFQLTNQHPIPKPTRVFPYMAPLVIGSFELLCANFIASVIAVQSAAKVAASCQFSRVWNKLHKYNYSFLAVLNRIIWFS